MPFIENPKSSGYLVQSFNPGEIRIDGVVYSQSLILTPKQIIPHWPPHTATEITVQQIEALLQLHPEVVLIGTGSQQYFLNAALLAPLTNRQIGVEMMATDAACRTFNLLAAEGRQVVAALIIN